MNENIIFETKKNDINSICLSSICLLMAFPFSSRIKLKRICWSVFLEKKKKKWEINCYCVSDMV